MKETTTTTTAPAFNLFANAKKVEPKSTSSKEKEKIAAPGTEKDAIRYNEIKTELSNLEAEKEMIRGRLIDILRPIYLKTFATQKSRPESFQLVDGAGKVMCIVMDAYKKVEAAKESALQAFDGVLETKTVYSINPDILSKEGVGEALSNAIMSAQGISDEDKLNLLQAKETKAVKKGTIDRLLSFTNHEELFYLIEPTIQLK